MTAPTIIRNDKIVARYLDGETLQSIGDTFGLTRERIRQILDDRNVTRRAGGPQPGVAYERWAVEHGDTIEAELRAETSRKAGINAVAARHPEMPITWIRRIARERIAPDHWPVVPFQHAQYSDDEMLDALCRYATSDGHISTKRYTKLANPDRDPSAGTYVLRWGSWNAAVVAAGLTPRARLGEYSSAWTDEDLLGAIRTYLSDAKRHRTVPTLEGYESWRRHHPHRQPSFQLIRIRFQMGWHALLRKVAP